MVVLTLEQLHDWILEAREIQYDSKHEDMLPPSKVFITQDTNKDTTEVQTAFREVLEAVQKLDRLFHDKFGCC